MHGWNQPARAPRSCIPALSQPLAVEIVTRIAFPKHAALRQTEGVFQLQRNCSDEQDRMELAASYRFNRPGYSLVKKSLNIGRCSGHVARIASVDSENSFRGSYHDNLLYFATACMTTASSPKLLHTRQLEHKQRDSLGESTS